MGISPFAWVLIGFLSGSVPYSFLLGKWLLAKDIRSIGDGNPGASNVILAGGRWSGALAILLDGFKAAIPVGLACYTAHLEGLWLLSAALAPVLGHMYSPFLKGRGGKAVAAAYGMWAGLTLGEMPIVLGLLMTLFALTFENSAWVVLFTLLGGLAHLLISHPDPFLLLVWAVSAVFLLWKQRAGLATPPRLRIFRHIPN